MPKLKGRDRRQVLKAVGLGGLSLGLGATALGLNACDRAKAQKTSPSPLKSRVPYPLGTVIASGQIEDPSWVALATTHFSRLTPEWEMKMEYILQPDGQCRFDAPQAIIDFASAHDLEVHGHTLIWYAEDKMPYFQNLAHDKRRFEAAYRDYITTVMTRFPSRLSGWDVVNEAFEDNGRLRPCLWAEVLGEAYMDIAFEAAKATGFKGPLFINDYNLEYYPKKRQALMDWVKGARKRGVPIEGIGSQTHLDTTLNPQALSACLKDLASLDLRLHISEVDISLNGSGLGALNPPQLRDQQKALMHTLGAEIDRLKPEALYGVTFWGLRDQDSWLNRDQKRPLQDEPNLFDRDGLLKPMGEAFFKP